MDGGKPLLYRQQLNFICLLYVVHFGCLTAEPLVWTNYPSMNGNQYFCNGDTALLIWDFTTDESVLSLEWYKQPGDIKIADFALNKFSPSDNYAHRVSRYSVSQYKAAIQLTDVTESDEGEYSCVVKASYDYNKNGKIYVSKREALSIPVLVSSPNCTNTTCTSPHWYRDLTLTMYQTIDGSELVSVATRNVISVNTCGDEKYRCCLRDPGNCNPPYCASSPEPTIRSTSTPDTHLHGGVVAVIVIGLLAGFVVINLLIIYIYRKCQRQRRAKILKKYDETASNQMSIIMV